MSFVAPSRRLARNAEAADPFPATASLPVQSSRRVDADGDTAQPAAARALTGSSERGAPTGGEVLSSLAPARGVPGPMLTVRPPSPPPPYYSLRVFPAADIEALTRLACAWRDVRAEVESVGADAWRAWPERNLYRADSGMDWTVLPFAYTFPADDLTQRRWVGAACAACPRTAELLLGLGPSLRTALLSRLAPHTSLVTHEGWAQLSNHVLRLHLPLRLPGAGGMCSGVIVSNEIRYHTEGELLVFDDSLAHSGFNSHPSEARMVLIIDLARPPLAAPGSATGGTTRELEEFIAHVL